MNMHKYTFLRRSKFNLQEGRKNRKKKFLGKVTTRWIYGLQRGCGVLHEKLLQISLVYIV